MDILYQIRSGYFTAGICLSNKRDKLKIEVYRAAPIIRYMIGWTLDKVLMYCKKKKWEAIHVNTVPVP